MEGTLGPPRRGAVLQSSELSSEDGGSHLPGRQAQRPCRAGHRWDGQQGWAAGMGCSCRCGPPGLDPCSALLAAPRLGWPSFRSAFSRVGQLEGASGHAAAQALTPGVPWLLWHIHGWAGMSLCCTLLCAGLGGSHETPYLWSP